MKISTLLLSILLASATAWAAPVVPPGSIVNTASFTPAGLPTSGIAQGSIFAVFGSGLGPATIVYAGFPLPTTLGGAAGTSIQVTSGATTVSAFMIFAQAGQLAAILPSSLPPGPATLTVTFNGQTSTPTAFQIVQSAFGVFTYNNQGTGPAVLQNFVSGASQPFNNLVTPAQPGQVEILWGTGLGAYGGAENVAPVPGLASPIGTNVAVLVGGVSATIQYNGRTPCCAGEDEIVFVVPQGVLGCYIPVEVVVNGVISNAGTMAISSSSSAPCSDSNGFSASEQQQLKAGGNINLGRITLLRRDQRTFNQQGQPIETVADTGNAAFASASSSALLAQPPLSPFNLESYVSNGNCAVYTFVGTVNGFPTANGASLGATALNAGVPFTVTGPNGAKPIPPGNFGSGAALYLSPGPYTVTGPAGTDVGAIQAAITLPATPFSWTNEPPIANSVSLTKGLVITWTGGSPTDFVVVTGFSEPVNSGAGFVCSAPNSAGQLTVPSVVLAALPGSSNNSPGFLSVTNKSPVRFQASGLNAGFLTAVTEFDDIVFYNGGGGGGAGNTPVVFTGTAASVSGTLSGTQIFDGDPTATGSVAITAAGVSSAGGITTSAEGPSVGGQTVYTGSASGSGTVSCLNITGSNTTGNWTLSLTAATITLSPSVTSLAASGGSVSGTFIATLSFTACGQTVATGPVTGTVTGAVSPGGAVTLSTTISNGGGGGGPCTAVLAGTGTSLTGSIPGACIQNLNNHGNITGNVPVSLTGTTSNGQTVYTGTLDGSGNVSCGNGSTSSWTAHFTLSITVSPSVPSLATNGGVFTGGSFSLPNPSSSSLAFCGNSGQFPGIAAPGISGKVSPGGATAVVIGGIGNSGNSPLVFAGTATSLSGTLPGAQLFKDNSATGNVTITATGVSSASQTVFSGSGSGTGTISCGGTPGTWTASFSSGTIIVGPSVTSLATNGGSVSGTWSGSISVTVCGASQTQLVVGTVSGTVSAGGAVTLAVIQLKGLAAAGTAQSISGMLLGTDLLDKTATGNVTFTATGVSAGNQTVYTGSGSGSGTVSCVGFTGANITGNWTTSLSIVFTVSPSVPSLATNGGSISGTTGSALLTNSVCGVTQVSPMDVSVTGTVSPGGAVTLGLD